MHRFSPRVLLHKRIRTFFLKAEQPVIRGQDISLATSSFIRRTKGVAPHTSKRAGLCPTPGSNRGHNDKMLSLDEKGFHFFQNDFHKCPRIDFS